MKIRHLEDETDELLLLKLAQGNAVAFNALYKKYWGQAYSFAYKRLKDSDQAKDIVQDIFVNIWIRKKANIDNFPAYLNIAVRNRIFKFLEKQEKMHPFLNILENISDHNLNADIPIQYKEFYIAYEALLEALPPKRQQIFRLHFQQDLSTEVIANQLRISRKTVQNQLGKAINQLRISLLHLFTLIIVLIAEY